MMNYGYTNYSYNPMTTPQQRLAQLEQQYPQFAPQPQQITQPPMQRIQASLVMSKEEATAQTVPMDGSLGIFVNFAGNEIYTKKLGNNGLPEFKTFISQTSITNINPEKSKSNPDIENLKIEIEELKKEIEELKNVKQSDADVSTIRPTKK